MNDLGIRAQVALAGLTTLKVGGKAEFFVQPRTSGELLASWQWAHQRGMPVTVMGAGSNLLISDRGLSGLVICTRYLRGAEWGTNGQVRVWAGEPLVKLAWQASDRGWSGMEWAVGIPGTVGGMVYMNAGAQGGCCADILHNIQAIAPDGSLVSISREQLQFGYRYSILQSPPWSEYVVLSANLQLRAGFVPETIRTKTHHNFQSRHATQPYHLPNCGSVFRNPYPHTAGYLIEQAGLKGYTIGGAQVSTMHANFIVNLGGATAQAVYQLIHHVQTVIEQKYGIKLHPEVKILGSFSDT